MFKNYSYAKTPTTSDYWINLSDENRIELINNELKKDDNLKDFEVHKTTNDGQIVF